MARLIVDTPGGTYPVHIGRGVLKELRRTMARLEPTAAVVIADTSVRPIAHAAAKHLKAARVKNAIYVVPGGERSKSLAGLAGLLAFLERQRIDRGGCIVAVGGGTVGDLAGMAASTWLRGIRYVEVPTTLLAMVDSSIGGKTGVNHRLGKNLIGTFHQPRLVVSDTSALASLPSREYASGLYEALKYGVICDRELFEMFREQIGLLLKRDREAIERLAEPSCAQIRLRVKPLPSR